MAGDRARITHFAPRQYREVVSLQGRVLLEADWNEGQRIFTEQQRLHALDVIGPWGTPDDGYRIGAPPVDFTIGPGTMYTGGLRTTLAQAIHYGSQPDWLDTAQPQPWGDGLWIDPAQLGGGNWHALLLLREQELGATEDPGLRDVALGGPDTAARTRLLQRIVAMPSDASTCPPAAKITLVNWSQLGYDWDFASAALRSRARLQVTMVTNPPAPSPCDPPAASGYLGADNQLLRVQVVAFDAATGKGKLLWAYNNGSTLYRCRVVDATTVELATRPVSSEYQPRAGAVVQVLMAAADLGEGAYAAALTGHWATLTVPYDADTRRITLPAALPGVLSAAPATPPLFLRLWEQELDFILDTPVALTGTGLQVTLSHGGGAVLPLGDYWSFGARPATPNAVYPERYLSAPQPPDGPRQWVAPLAVLGPAAEAGLGVLDDCRLPFDNLPELTARKGGGDTCCCITVGPDRAHELQRIIDEATVVAGGRVTLHLQAGKYALPEPLIIDRRHTGLTLAPCSGARPLLMAAQPEHPAFSHGLVVVLDTEGISLEGVDFALARSAFDDALRAPFEQAGGPLPLDWVPKYWSVGMHVAGCGDLSLTDCRFLFTDDVESSFGAAVLLQGTNGKIALQDCEVRGRANRGNDSLLLGVCLAPLLQVDDGGLHASSAALLRIGQCMFLGLDIAMLLVGQAAYLDVDGNMTRQVGTSLWHLGIDDSPPGPRDVLALIDHWAGTAPALAQLWSRMRNDRELMRALCTALLMAPGKLPIRPGKPAADLLPRIVVHANRFGTFPPGSDRSSIDTLLWELNGVATHLLVTANSFINVENLPTLTVALDGAFNITGNVIENRAAAFPGSDFAMALLIKAHNTDGGHGRFTVTGNTIVGRTNLEQFPRGEWSARLPAELKNLLTWEFFNAIG
jgi:hypothetical protein